MIEIRRLATILLGLAVTLVIIGLATPHWGCGSLFQECQRYSHRDAIIAVLVLLIIGLVCVGLVFLLDLIGVCSDVFVTSAGYVTVRFILLYLGTACLLTALLVFTGKSIHAWSYFLATVGCVFAVQVAILAIMSSHCVSVRTERVVVRTTKA